MSLEFPKKRLNGLSISLDTNHEMVTFYFTVNNPELIGTCSTQHLFVLKQALNDLTSLLIVL